MKHALLLLVSALVLYGIYHSVWPLKSRRDLDPLKWHAQRVGAIVLALLVLLALAYYLPSIGILT